MDLRFYPLVLFHDYLPNIFVNPCYIAINIVATFVHNEPTSLTAIQEAKLPETIFKAFETGIEPSFEVSDFVHV